MIEDKELNALFKQESTEHLNALEAGVLALEKDPAQPELHEAIMREAHSLKGAARMLGLTEIETLSHNIESLLRDLIGRDVGFSQDETRDILNTIDSLRSLSRIAVEGEAAPVPAANDTIRITTDRLDRLMTDSGELQVLEKRISSQTSSLQSLSALIESNLRLHRTLENTLARMADSDEKRGLASIILDISESWEKLGEAFYNFSDASTNDISYLHNISARIDDSIRELRMMPLAVLFDQFQRMLRDLSADLGKPIEIVIDGADVMADKRVIEELKDALMHLLRNALEHGIEAANDRETKGKARAGMIKMRGIRTTSSVMIEIEDDGRGLDLDRIRTKARKLGMLSDEQIANLSTEQTQNLIFRSGLSTQEVITDLSGRGVGLDVVATAVARLKGEIIINSQPDQGTGFRLVIPQNFATTNVTLVIVSGQTFAIPVDAIHAIRFIDSQEIEEIESQATIQIEGQPVSLILLEELLGLAPTQRSLHEGGRHASVTIAVDDVLLTLVVEQVTEEQSIVVKPPGAFLKRIRNIAGVGLLSNGDIVTMLSPRDLIGSVHGAARQTKAPLANAALTVLLAEDSMITRTQEKRILEAAGYDVIIAVDGQEAWKKLNVTPVDAVVSDIMMPYVDGFELTRRIRSDKRFADIPVILVTTLSSDEDRQRGLDAGANAYITKGGFNQKMLLEALGRLVGANANG